MTHPLAPSVVDALAQGRALSARDRAHLDACASCAESHARLCAVERALEGTDGLSARVLADLEARVMAAPGVAPPSWASRVARYWHLPVLSLAAAGAVLLLFFRAPLDTSGAPRGRGGSDPALAPRVQLLCVKQAGVAADVAMSDADAAPPELPCDRDGVLGFAVTTPVGLAPRQLFVVGLGPDGQPRWYHPRPEENVSLTLPPGTLTGHVLPAVRLSVNHVTGSTHVWAIFSEAPLSVAQLSTALAHGTLDASALDAVVVQHAQVVLP